MTIELLTDDFILNWLTTDGKAAHFCVDNQAYYMTKSFHERDMSGLHENNERHMEFADPNKHLGQKEFAENLNLFSEQGYSAFAATIQTMKRLDRDDVKKIEAENFHVDRIRHDAQTLRAKSGRSLFKQTYCDLINQNYEKNWVHIKHRMMWSGKAGQLLANKIDEIKCNKLVVTGAFAELCVTDAILNAPDHIEKMIDPAFLWSRYGGTLSYEQAYENFEGYPNTFITQPGQLHSVMTENRLLNL